MPPPPIPPPRLPDDELGIEVCEASAGRSIVMLPKGARRPGPRSARTLLALAEAAAFAAVMGAFAGQVDEALVTHAQIEFLGTQRDADVATASLTEPIDAIAARLRRTRRTEVDVRVALGDREGTRMVKASMRYSLARRRARRADSANVTHVFRDSQQSL